MSLKNVAWVLLLSATALLAQEGERTAPFTAAEREAVYAASIQRRADTAIRDLGITDTNKIARVHGAIVAQYRALRARDEAMDTMFKALSSNTPDIATNRSLILPALSKELHAQFLRRLNADLTPEQVEVVKDKMTYNKVGVTYDAYCQIFPDLTPKQKEMILEALKQAREEAMDGGTADEKSAAFQKYKDKINASLEAQGLNIAQSFERWEKQQATVAAGNPIQPAASNSK